ncbi:MAG: hypothetical protein JRN20_07610 [Nitrososphaerota archaeon]|nr:hypothetical protein [Nitrososphaerota archaeon]
MMKITPRKHGLIALLTFVLLFLLSPALTAVAPLPRVAAQTQNVVATPGSVNLGMNVNIQVTAPGAGTYTVVVVKPLGAKVSMNESFTSAGQVQNATFGNSTSGFKGIVDQSGTYNVFVEQGNTLVASTSFYATNKLNVMIDMITGSTCAYTPGGTRGMEMFPRFYITYASNGGPVTNTDKGIVVTYTLPDNTNSIASWHAPNTKSQSTTGFFMGRFLPAWNYTNVGPWVPIVKVSDSAGNTVTWTYVGSPFTISTATLSIGTSFVDTATNQTINGLQNGENIEILANVTYPAPPNGAAAVTGFVGPLDSTVHGGSVNALVGWGYYNRTSGSFGGKLLGGLISQVSLNYNTKTHLWSGTFNTTSLPSLSGGNKFEVVITAKDAASPSNMGSSMLSLTAASASSTTQSSSISSNTTQSSGTSSTSSVIGIAVWAYAATTISLIIGVIVGFIARKK